MKKKQLINPIGEGTEAPATSPTNKQEAAERIHQLRQDLITLQVRTETKVEEIYLDAMPEEQEIRQKIRQIESTFNL